MLNKTRGNELIDYYGNLLTDHQLEILNDYFLDDLSMIEIAENYEISKAAVSDLIKRCTNQLEEYENKLKLIEKDKNLDKIVIELESSGNKDIATKIKQIIRR